MNFPVNAQILDFCVLGALSLEDAYGYSLTQTFSENFGLSESTLYPVLRRLRDERLLETYDREFQGRNRRYYRITAEGRERLLAYRKDWETYKKKIDGMLPEEE